MRKPVMFYGVLGLFIVISIVVIYLTIPKLSEEEKAMLILQEELLSSRTEKPTHKREMQTIHDITFTNKQIIHKDGTKQIVPIVKLKTDIGYLDFDVKDVKFKLILKNVPMLEFTRQEFQDIPYTVLLSNNKIKESYKKLSGVDLEETLKKGSKDAEGFEKEFFDLITNHEQLLGVEIQLPSGTYQNLEHYFNPKELKKREKELNKNLNK